MSDKKGQGLNLLLVTSIMILIIVVILGMGGKILGDMAVGTTNISAMRNASIHGGSTINDMAKYLPTIGLIVMIAVILGLLLTYLYQKFVK